MLNLPSLRQLEYLVALSRRLNFTQAAADCFVTQSTLSAGIKELEATLGVQLVERDRQRVLLTALGAAVLKRADVLLAEARDLVQFTSTQGDPLAGEICLAAIPTIAPFFLPELLRDLRSACPDLRIRIREEQSAQLLANLRAGLVDFAIIALPYPVDGLQVRPLFLENLCMVMAADAPDVQPHPDRLLLLEEGHCLRDHTLQSCPAPQPGSRLIEASSLYTLLQMVEEGWGWAAIPEMAVQAGLPERMGLLARPFIGQTPSRQIALVSRVNSARRELFEKISSLAAVSSRQTAEGNRALHTPR